MTESHNPYAAPAATVDDVLAPGSGVPPLHPHVRRACVIMWWSLAIGMLGVPVSLKRQLESMGTGTSIWALAVGAAIGFVFAVAIIWWITAKLRAGRNWMRWLLNISTGIWAVSVLLLWGAGSPVVTVLLSYPLELAFSVVQWIFTIAVLVLVNTTAAREWFAEMKLHAR
jgi:hypothetical protein